MDSTPSSSTTRAKADLEVVAVGGFLAGYTGRTLARPTRWTCAGSSPDARPAICDCSTIGELSDAAEGATADVQAAAALLEDASARTGGVEFKQAMTEFEDGCAAAGFWIRHLSRRALHT